MSEALLTFTDPYPDEDEYNGTEDYAADPTLLCVLQDVRDFSRLFVPVTYSLICVCGLLGNVLVVLTFACYKKAKSMTDVYLLNMALADILFVLTLPFWAATHAAGRWAFSGALCKLVRGVYAVNFHCGMLLLACISLDRYVAIVQATRSFRLRARLRAHRRAICLAVWALSALLSAWAFVFAQKYPLQGREVCEPRYLAVAEPLRWKLLPLGLQLLWGFFVPLLVMAGCYLLIVRALLRAQNSRRHRAVRVIVAVVLVFLACQVPHNAVLLATAANLGRLGRSCRAERALRFLEAGTEVLAFLHCCLNPVLYAFVGHRFRSHFLRAAKDLLCLGQRRAPSLACGRLPSEAFPSRQTSETAAEDNPSSFTM
ncbi:C-C chemokine receptor type 6 [Pipistrellus kuhlii]|uniref:C-C motif chemokine receptor 6 n=1 Tax=Pipistrellus kuhlii TaxID=59472 RepID=A0A7J7RD97_PIPKU|nr:C-C chemokine receptor type 6 [Pipistrellus kuhlii]KAF6274014.1 C-C motif chemokine receptor 6 [Pipistrellus kuhlii]